MAYSRDAQRSGPPRSGDRMGRDSCAGRQPGSISPAFLRGERRGRRLSAKNSRTPSFPSARLRAALAPRPVESSGGVLLRKAHHSLGQDGGWMGVREERQVRTAVP